MFQFLSSKLWRNWASRIMYNVLIRRKALKEIAKLPKKSQISVSKAIKALAENPFPRGYKKLIGTFRVYRIRIGDCRVIYDIIEEELIIDIVRVRHRKDVYR